MEIKTPIVSILIPTRNRVNKLKKCLDNLFKTCYDKYNFEVLCGVDIKLELWTDRFIEYYEQVIIYIDNR